jgi:hypothetical protein
LERGSLLKKGYQSSRQPSSGAAPEGYLDLLVEGKKLLVRDWAAEAVCGALAAGTLYEWAAAQPSPDLMRGRGISYGVALPCGSGGDSSTAVVIRRNRHGGLLRFLTGEHFLLPTRAPLELETALRLAEAGIPTPEVIACVVYPVAGIFARSDVMTRRLPKGDDLPAVWRDADVAARSRLIEVIGGLLRLLRGAGAWHADLNLKNIYIAGTADAPQAYLLDVDRVTFPEADWVAQRNFDRLARSARKWRERWRLDFDEESLTRLRALALERQ